MTDEPERELLELVARYAVMLPAFVAEARDLTEDQAERILKNLVADGVLARAHLCPGNDYYHLSPLGAELVGMPETAGRPLPPTRVAKCYAAGFFCLMGECERTKLTTEEFQEQAPDLYYDGALDFCFEQDGPLHRLCRMQLDRGGPETWERAITAARRFIIKRRPGPNAMPGSGCSSSESFESTCSPRTRRRPSR